jgi:hypothetical protein
MAASKELFSPSRTITRAVSPAPDAGPAASAFELPQVLAECGHGIECAPAHRYRAAGFSSQVKVRSVLIVTRTRFVPMPTNAPSPVIVLHLPPKRGFHSRVQPSGWATTASHTSFVCARKAPWIEPT